MTSDEAREEARKILRRNGIDDGIVEVETHGRTIELTDPDARGYAVEAWVYVMEPSATTAPTSPASGRKEKLGDTKTNVGFAEQYELQLALITLTKAREQALDVDMDRDPDNIRFRLLVLAERGYREALEQAERSIH